MQGYTEGSNVSVLEEFINLIVAQRGYEANSQVCTGTLSSVVRVSPLW